MFANLPAGPYFVYVAPEGRFRYMCNSTKEFSSTSQEYFYANLNQSTQMDIGLLEGFLTMPLRKRTFYRVNAYFDEGGDRNWMGQPNGDPNHEGTDFAVPIGTPVFSAAPGTVKYVDDWGPVGIFVIVSHSSFTGEDVMSTLYAHLSKSEVQEGQAVERGTRLGISGEDETHPGPHLHFELDFGFHGSPKRASWYRPVDPFKSLWNPNFIGYWTKENDPQYSVT